MTQHESTRRNKVIGAARIGAVVLVVAAAPNGVGTANATCVSIAGFSIGTGCTSSLTSFAIGIGPNATAAAVGFFSGALSLGIANGPSDITDAFSAGNLSFAYAGGRNTFANTGSGALLLAAVQGNGVFAQAGNAPGDFGDAVLNLGDDNFIIAGGRGNLAVNFVGSRNQVTAGPDIGNIALNAFGNDNFVGAAPGRGSTAFNVGGNFNTVNAEGVLSNASNILGNDNLVFGGPGPLAAAVSLLRSNQSLDRSTFGITLNGRSVPGLTGTALASTTKSAVRNSAAVPPAKPTHPAHPKHPSHPPKAKGPR